MIQIRKNKNGVFRLQHIADSTVKKTFYVKFFLREEDDEYGLGGLFEIDMVFIDGKKEGLWRLKDSGGQITEETYKNGLLHGIRKIYDRIDGKLHYETVFENGTGLYRNYYWWGQLMMEGNMESGQREGTWKYYNREGFCIKTENYKQGMLDGNFQVLDTLGNTLYQTEFVNGTGLYKSFRWWDGKLIEEGQMEQGLRVGEWIEIEHYNNHGIDHEIITTIQYDKNAEEKKKKNLIWELYVDGEVIYLLAAD